MATLLDVDLAAGFDGLLADFPDLYRRSHRLRRPERLSLAEWADRNYILPSGDANAGRWRTIPYQKGLMDAMSDPDIEIVAIMKSARVGYTKIFCALVGYHIDHDPCQMMIVQPTLDDAKRHSKEDLAPMLAEVPVLEGRVADPKAKDSDNTVLEKRFDGGSLSLIGANSPRGFRRTSRRLVIFDELDGYPLSAGTEGDPVSLGMRRTEYYWNRKIIFGSTPTFTGRSRIERAFLDGDQRRFYVPCPHCGAFQVLKWENLHPTPEGDAIFTCVARGCTIHHRSKRTMVEAGEWRAEKPENYRLLNGRGSASFHIWAAYSYSPNATWAQLWREWEKAQDGGPLVRQTFRNTVQGETWQDRGEAPAWELIHARAEDYTPGTVPDAGAIFLTCGVDVQADRLVYEVVAWGRGRTSWSVEWGNLMGETANMQKGPWTELDKLLARKFPRVDGGTMVITRLAIDSGYNTTQVHAWTRRHPASLVMAIKGQGIGSILVEPPRPYEMNRGGKTLRTGRKAWMVSGHVAKNELYGFLRLQRNEDGSYPPGYVHLPNHGEEFFKQLTAEELKVSQTARGLRLTWQVIEGRANHALDCRVYARAAAYALGLDRMTEREWDAMTGAAPKPPPRPVESQEVSAPLPPSRPSRPQGWLGGGGGLRRQRGGWLR